MKRSPHLTLELLRGGTPHNQLVSPAIEYLALCGDAAPYTLHIPFEHRDLTDSLLVLRYEYGGRQKNAERLRKAELERLARQIGDLLGSIPAFAAEISGIDPPGNGDIVHLRLVLAGNELSLIPWELTQVPDGLSAAGLFLLLQPRIPISMTREVRGASRRQIAWDQKPKILFATTTAGDFPPKTIEAHYLSLRYAMEPWTYQNWETNGWQQDEYPIDIIQRATVEEIRQKCIDNEYTHVHILAHGSQVGEEGDFRYGLKLHKSHELGEREIVNGEQLSQALLPSRSHWGASDPVMVTLATCDSANQANTVNPGGSVAHTLHHMGVPWVIASQFPLTVKGSVILATDFYKDLFQGADPRMALHKIRQHLNTRFGDRHDWATVVAYASFPLDFDYQVEEFRQRAMQQQRNHAFALVDQAVFGFLIKEELKIKTDEKSIDQKKLTKLKERFPLPTIQKLQEIRELLEICIKRMKGMEKLGSDDLTPRTRQVETKLRLKRSEYWTIRAALHKRIAELDYLELKIRDDKSGLNNNDTWIKQLSEALDDYGTGLKQDIQVDHWLLVQYFVLKYVVFKLSGKEIKFSKREEILRKQAEVAIELELNSDKPTNKVWAHSSKADLSMLTLLESLQLTKISLSIVENQTTIESYDNSTSNPDDLITVMDGETDPLSNDNSNIKPKDVISEVEMMIAYDIEQVIDRDSMEEVQIQLKSMLNESDSTDPILALFSTFRQFWRWHEWWLPEIGKNTYNKFLLAKLSEDAYTYLLKKAVTKLCPD